MSSSRDPARVPVISAARGSMLAVVACALALFAGCRPASDDGNASSQASSEASLLLYCGAGIRWPVAELAETFSNQHGVKLECDYAGSELLLSRIKLSGQGDLYMPGDVYYVEQAEAEALVTEKTTVCYLVPVILVQKGNPKSIYELQDLLKADVKLGLGDVQACAIGRNSEQIFQRAGIRDKEIADHVEFRSLTVNELGTDVAMGALDAAIVWDAVAANFADKTDIVAIAAEDNVVSTVAVGVLRSSGQPQLARQFITLLTSPEGQAVFAKYHYTTSPSEVPARTSASGASPFGGEF